MVKKSIFLVMTLLLMSGACAQAVCTPEDAQIKAWRFMDIAVQLAQKEPDRYAEVARAMQTELPELQKNGDHQGLCKFYDTWIEKMK